MYFYSDTGPRGQSDLNVWKMDGSKGYLRHFDNFLILILFAKEGSREERAQAERELLICKRKMGFWEKHPNYDAALVQKEKEQRIKLWRQRPTSGSGVGKISLP